MSLVGKTILVADDEADIRELIKEELEERGAQVLEAENGKTAYKQFEDNKVHAVISDIRMPGGDGVELVKNIKGKEPELPIFLITGFADYTGNELKLLGVEAVIFKPFDMKEVMAMVQQKVTSSK